MADRHTPAKTAMVNTEFIVNKEKRTIVCIITTVNDIPLKLNKYNLVDNKYDDFNEIRIYKGFARCAPEDEWDENYGKHLAEYRASRARQKDVNHELKNYIKTISKRIDSLYDYGLLKDPHKPEEK